MTKRQQTISILQKGGVAVMATDTIYGLVGKVSRPEAVDKIYRLKKRRPDKPCIILIADIRDLKRYGITLDTDTKKILKLVWPGPVSVVLPQGQRTLAFRLPQSIRLRRLLAQSGPLIAPSANPEGQPPARTIREAKAYFGRQVDIYLDSGTKSGAASAIIGLRRGKITVLRPGRLPSAVLKYLAP